jgi:hypothetical protein
MAFPLYNREATWSHADQMVVESGAGAFQGYDALDSITQGTALRYRYMPIVKVLVKNQISQDNYISQKRVYTEKNDLSRDADYVTLIVSQSWFSRESIEVFHESSSVHCKVRYACSRISIQVVSTSLHQKLLDAQA